MIVRDQALGRQLSFGRTLFCPENDTALSSLETTLQTAQSAGVDPSNPILQAAQAFYSQASGFFSGDWIATGSACSDDVTQAKQQIANVNALITAASSGSPPPLIDPGQIPTPQASLWASLGLPQVPSWVLPVGAGLVGLGLVAYLVHKFKRTPRREVSPPFPPAPLTR